MNLAQKGLTVGNLTQTTTHMLEDADVARRLWRVWINQKNTTGPYGLKLFLSFILFQELIWKYGHSLGFHAINQSFLSLNKIIIGGGGYILFIFLIKKWTPAWAHITHIQKHTETANYSPISSIKVIKYL